MKPTNRELNARLRECFGSLPYDPAAIMDYLRGGGIYIVHSFSTNEQGVSIHLGQKAQGDIINSAKELFKA